MFASHVFVTNVTYSYNSAKNKDINLNFFRKLEFQGAIDLRNPSSYGWLWRAFGLADGPLAHVDGGVQTCPNYFWEGYGHGRV